MRRSQQEQKEERAPQRGTKQTTKQKTHNRTTPHGQNRTSQHRRADATQQRKVQRGEQAEASKQGRSRRPGRQQRQEEASTSQEDGHVQLYRCPKRILDHPRANTSVPERGAHEQHPPHGGEGKAPHRAEAFVAMKRSEDRTRSPTDTPCQRYGNRTVADTTRYPEGGISKQQTGPEDTRRQGGKGGGKQGGSGPNCKHPRQTVSNNKKAT